MGRSLASLPWCRALGFYVLSIDLNIPVRPAHERIATRSIVGHEA